MPKQGVCEVHFRVLAGRNDQNHEQQEYDVRNPCPTEGQRTPGVTYGRMLGADSKAVRGVANTVALNKVSDFVNACCRRLASPAAQNET